MDPTGTSLLDLSAIAAGAVDVGLGIAAIAGIEVSAPLALAAGAYALGLAAYDYFTSETPVCATYINADTGEVGYYDYC